ncbi:hypothetical protein AcW1_010022 [Taiwanofungus camphoratus]|nr:hypothetical protein AcW1_010022 [Antrodia cinnamomea]
METIPESSPPPSFAAEAFMPTQPFMPTPTPEGGPALHVSAVPEAIMYATAPKVQVFQGTCSSQDETPDSLLAAIRESLQHISYTLHVDRDAYSRIIQRDVNKYHTEAYGLEWRDTAQAALQVANQMVALIGAEHIADLNGIGHLATRVRELVDIRVELEATIAEQRRTIGEMSVALTSVLPKPSDQWFEGARTTLGAIATSTTNDSGKLIQAVTTNTSTLRALSKRVEGIAATAPGYAAATASSSAKQTPKQVRIQSPPNEEPKSAPADKGKKRAVPPSLTRSRAASPAAKKANTAHVIDLTADDGPNWDDIRGATEIVQIAPNISLSDALRIAQGMAAPAQVSCRQGDSRTRDPRPHPGIGRGRGIGPTMQARDPTRSLITIGAISPVRPPPVIKHATQPAWGASPKTVVLRFDRALELGDLLDIDSLKAVAQQLLAGAGGSVNYLVNAIVPPGNGEVHLVFSERPSTTELDGMNPVRLSLDWAHIITQMAIKVFPLYWDGTRVEYTPLKVFQELVWNNEWAEEVVLHPHHSPKACYQSASGGSGLFIFAIFDTRSGSTAIRIMKKPVCLFGKTYRLQPWIETSAVPLCLRCSCCAQRWAATSVKTIACPPEHVSCPNCGKTGDDGHQADSPKCQWAKKRRDQQWHKAHPPVVSVAKGRAAAAKAATRGKLHGLSEKAHGKQPARPGPSGESLEITNPSDAEGVSGHESREIHSSDSSTPRPRGAGGSAA